MNNAMEKVRDYIALIMTIAVLIMVGLKVPMPDRIWDIYMMIIAFFFGSKPNGKDTPNVQSDTAILQPTIQESPVPKV